MVENEKQILTVINQTHTTSFYRLSKVRICAPIIGFKYFKNCL